MPLDLGMQEQLTKGQCKQFLMIYTTKKSSAMSMIRWSSPKRVWTTYKICVWSLSDYRDVNWRWIHSSVHLVSPQGNSWASSFITEGLRSANWRLRQSKRCPSLRISGSFVDFKIAWYISEDSSQMLQDVAIPSATLWKRMHRLSGMNHFVRLLRK